MDLHSLVTSTESELTLKGNTHPVQTSDDNALDLTASMLRVIVKDSCKWVSATQLDI